MVKIVRYHKKKFICMIYNCLLVWWKRMTFQSNNWWIKSIEKKSNWNKWKEKEWIAKHRPKSSPKTNWCECSFRVFEACNLHLISKFYVKKGIVLNILQRFRLDCQFFVWQLWVLRICFVCLFVCQTDHSHFFQIHNGICGQSFLLWFVIWRDVDCVICWLLIKWFTWLCVLVCVGTSSPIPTSIVWF